MSVATSGAFAIGPARRISLRSCGLLPVATRGAELTALHRHDRGPAGHFAALAWDERVDIERFAVALRIMLDPSSDGSGDATD
jgi:hypothetical protein